MMTRLLIVVTGLFCITLAAGCIRVPHLGDRTGEAYDAVFARQQRRRNVAAPKPMEAELGKSASKRMVSGASKPASAGRPALAGGPLRGLTP
jgi:hypothetical protein